MLKVNEMKLYVLPFFKEMKLAARSSIQEVQKFASL
jgi:hypothetical protein